MTESSSETNLLFTKAEWDAAIPNVVRDMTSFLSHRRAPVFEDHGDHGNGWGSGSFLQLGRRVSRTNMYPPYDGPVAPSRRSYLGRRTYGRSSVTTSNERSLWIWPFCRSQTACGQKPTIRRRSRLTRLPSRINRWSVSCWRSPASRASACSSTSAPYCPRRPWAKPIAFRKQSFRSARTSERSHRANLL